MTSSVRELSDNCENREQQEQSDSHVQTLSRPSGLSQPGVTTPNAQYAAPQAGAGHSMALATFPYPDPYYRSIFAPYDTQAYPPQPYSGQAMVHLQLMGIQQAGVPLPSDAVEEPVFVNAKQYHGIMRRRQTRAKLESQKKIDKQRKPYLHESRHLHALRRPRGCGGRFLNAKKDESEQSDDAAVAGKPHPNIKTNSDITENAACDGAS